MTIWFTSDWHVGHARILEFCPNRNVRDLDEMHSLMADGINARVAPNDDLYLLGDMFMGQLERSLRFRSWLTVNNVFLVPGNHDRCHPMFGAKADVWRERYVDAGIRVLDATIGIVGMGLPGGPNLTLNHFPYAPDEHDVNTGRANEYHDKFAQWRPADTGGWLLHGHVHDTYRQRGRGINVGVDAWGGLPVSEAQILDIVGRGERDDETIPMWK